MTPSESLLYGKIVALSEELAHLRLLLIRKNEALLVFADPTMWGTDDECHDYYHWLGGKHGTYADPMGFAQREADATEPDDR